MHLTARLAALVAMTLACSPLSSEAAPDATISYVSQFGSHGESPGQFYVPSGIGMDAAGQLIIADHLNDRLQRCTTVGACVVLANQLPGPRYVAVHSDGRLLVTGGASGVTVCSPQGDCSQSFGSFGFDPGQFYEARGIAEDSQGRIVVADRFNHRFQICDFEGQCTTHGTEGTQADAPPGAFNEPFSVATNKDDLIAIGETGFEVIHICDEQGHCNRKFGSEGQAVGQFKTPVGLGFTSRGDLVIAELSNNRISLCDLDGSCQIFGTSGSGNFQFNSPNSLYVDGDDRVYVADTGNNRIQVLQITYHSPPPPHEFLINAGLNDAWVNDEAPLQGLFITVFENLKLIFIAWFTFDSVTASEGSATFGAHDQRWVTALGTYSGGMATLTAELTTGGVFNDSQPVPMQDTAYGTIDLEFSNCNAAVLTYSFPAPGLSGSFSIHRVLEDNIALCEAFASVE